MFEVFKEFTFEAAHSLPHLPPEHKCHHLHGHSYHVKVMAKCSDQEITEAMVVDYAEISAVWSTMLRQLDHKFINDVLDCPTTSENLARWIYRGMNHLIPSVYAVEVRKTPSAGAIYRG